MIRTAVPALLCLIPAFALAQSSLARTTADYHARMDRNGDGRVALGEYQEFLSYGFHQMDRNRDGSIDQDELGSRSGRNRGPISLSDHRRSLARMFAKLDADGDGNLNLTEIGRPPM